MPNEQGHEVAATEAEENEELDTLFAGFAGDPEDAEASDGTSADPEVEEGVEPQGTASETEEPAAAPAWEGLFEGLTPEQTAFLAQRERELEQLEHRVSSDAGRVRTYQGQVSDLQKKVNQQAPVEEPPEVAALREDMPEAAKAIEAMVESRMGLREAAGGADNERLAALEMSAAKEEVALQQERLTEEHPDWREIAQSPEYARWYNMQSPRGQALASSNEADDVSRALDLYQMDALRDSGETGQDESYEDAQDELRSQGAEQPESGVAGYGGESAPGDDLDAAFEYYANRM